MTQKEIKESDYSFNQSIIDAFAQNTIVWRRPKLCKEWIKIGALEAQEMSFGQMFHYNDWSLEKPKIKILKWQFICKCADGIYILSNHGTTAEEIKSRLVNEDTEVISKYLPSQKEVEE